jgi:DNA-binding response OmpR family regulator
VLDDFAVRTVDVWAIVSIIRIYPYENFDEENHVKLLVIDDDPDIRNLLSRFFTRWGHEVDCIANGDEVIPFCHKRLADYDTVLLDVILPGIPGTGLYRWLREINEDIRIILITGMINSERVDTALREGAELMPKPFDTNDLKRIVIDGEPAIQHPA